MRHPSQVLTDTAIIGAGPVGCLAAIALAESGQSVTMLESNPYPTKKFAGEWLHPAGLEVLQKYDIPLDSLADSDYARGKGFVIYPDDDSEPVCLDYPAGESGFVCDHLGLVKSLRSKAESSNNITFLPFAEVNRLEKGIVSYQDKTTDSLREISASQIVGADGRRSMIRSKLGENRRPRLLSYMVGVSLDAASLPHEGYGHVFLKAPGPIIMYRAAKNTVRACLDVPVHVFRDAGCKKTLLLEEYCPTLPPDLAHAMAIALERDPLSVRPNQFMPRSFYGTDDFPLVGDAVGYHHPLTAMGMTLGFHDADALARSHTFREFERERLTRSYVPEILAVALYEAFSRKDKGARDIRQAIYQMWRKYPVERTRTMRLLAGEETNFLRFSQSFFRGIQLAVTGSVSASLRMQQLQVLPTLGSIGKLLYLLAKPSSSRLVPFGSSLTGLKSRRV
ncbi:MAG: hypothetical protein CMO55_24045 [Verrucomicrobiales bacterium]|nr:hypothetical protein [Verrucomicrobiales bacterium]